MTAPRARNTFGDAEVDRLLSEVLGSVGADANDDLVRRLLVTALYMDADDVDRLELKIASQALVEMHNAWRVFSPYRDRTKVTVFGSARTATDHPAYRLAHEFASRIAERGWMIISGAGPGIMTAAVEGAGVHNSLGVNIVLPAEQKATPLLDGDPKLATFRYFFTRKLFFMKESDAFVLLPGGFGTLDETFELLTLVQTGKSYPTPIVLLDPPGSCYWQTWLDFVEQGLHADGLISEADLGLYLHTHDVDEAAHYICHFYSTFHSIRFVGQRLVLRLARPLEAGHLDTLTDEFSDIIVSGSIESIEATEAEQRDDDCVDLPRVAFRFNGQSFARLHAMIRRINDLGLASMPASEQVALPPVQHPLHDLEPEPDKTPAGG
ncbi:MAG: TIGR00730 family Rossman fold protein [Actinomycetota bacterium]|nr:TIGR00730 family Rossman fold protein [Actinomycetota bacterium]